MNKMSKILIVEDEKSLQNALFEKLVRENYKIVLADDGEEGLKKAISEKPDLILLDIVMPNVDGIEMLRGLRDTKEGKDMPVMILTNLSKSDLTTEAMNLGAFDYLVKSDWSLEDLIKKINKKLS